VVAKANIIELNGKRYNARTGELLSSSAHHPAPVRHAAHAPTAHPGRQVMDVARPTHHVKHRVPKKSQTLMRSAVTKPEPSLRRKTKVTSHTHALTTKPEFRIVKKLSHPTVDVRRLRHAKQVPHSELIHRFADVGAPAMPAGPSPRHAVKLPAHAPAIHAVQAPVTTSPSMDVFERALQRANSHHEQPVKPTRKHRTSKKSPKRIVSVAAGALAVLLLAGFIVVQNQANLTMRYAATKAGFAATLPGYKPAGYKAGKFSYSPGMVGVNFSNTSSGEQYSLIQRESGWDSTTLVDTFVSGQANTYKTVETAGRTIYLYGNNATWVNGGVWYKVTSNGGLTTNDIVNIAASM
jgi:hypothetical protein